MDFNEEEVLISMRNIENSDEELNENGVAENGHTPTRHSYYQPELAAQALVFGNVGIWGKGSLGLGTSGRVVSRRRRASARILLEDIAMRSNKKRDQ